MNGDWIFERRPGFAGYRCRKCAAWVYEGKPKVCECDKDTHTIMTPEQETAFKTRVAWDIFNKLSAEELYILLLNAGVVIGETKRSRVAQALIVWFHGSIPNHVEWERLSKELPLNGPEYPIT